MRRDKTSEFVRHNFTPEELAIKAGILAQACQRLSAAEEEKKAAAAQFTERIATEKATIGKTSREMNQGWETRSVDCRILYNLPNSGMKSIVRTDTEEVIKTLSMTQDEMQDTLFTDPETAPDKEKAIEDNIRNFFNLVPADEADTSADPLEVHGWKNGEWIVAAASAEFAQQWMESKGYPVDGAFEWCNPDSTVIEGLETFFDRASLPLRAAIAHCEKEGIAFPMLLQIPKGYLEALHKGQDPTKPAAEPEAPKGDAPAADGKAGKPRRGRKPKAEPAAPQEPADDDQGDDDNTDAGESLEPGA